MKLEQQYRKAATTSFCAGIFFIGDKHTPSLFYRTCIVVFACFPFYYWIQYLKAYVDHKIDSLAVSSPRTESEQENDDNQHTPS